jgi:lipoyl(octanoyl) transferase
MYPIVRLKDAHGIREYVHTLEEIIIETLAAFGVAGVRVDGRAGIWLLADASGPDRKIAAIGIRVHDGVTMHGIAINANNDLAPYAQIIACGITDAGTTTIAAETGNDVGPAALVPILEAATRRLLGPLVEEFTPGQVATGTAAVQHPAEGALL